MDLNLIELLPADDKEKMTRYIKAYGAPRAFIGLDKWLKNWSYSKRTLYKLLGNQFIYKQPIKIKKSDTVIRDEYIKLMDTHPYIDSFFDIKSWYLHEIFDIDISYGPKVSNIPITTACNHCSIEVDNYVEDSFPENIKIPSNFGGKPLQLQKGMKMIKAIKKVTDFMLYELEQTHSSYLNCPIQSWKKQLDKTYEDFRIALSMVTNDKYITGNLCISIHPFDFITMSDNDSNWSSCMSWSNDGCYKIGTVEMMNSNNTLCCYIESKTPYDFSPVKICKKSEASSANVWNNKKWRVLVYVNKNIIMAGKSYPFYSEELNKILLSIVTDLAKKNLGWQYKYGPELYKDMIHIWSNSAMIHNKEWLRKGNTFKHNIIWDTKGMYNDMLNANGYTYWCYRNPVKHTIIYSVSGKAPCLCCGEPVLIENDIENYDYNERFSNSNSLVCNDCLIKYFCCGWCNAVLGKTYSQRFSKMLDIKLITRYHNRSEIDFKNICSECVLNFIKKCPCCGKLIWIDIKNFGMEHVPFYLPEKSKDENYAIECIPDKYFTASSQPAPLFLDPRTKINDHVIARHLYMCRDCLENLRSYFKIISIKDAHIYYETVENRLVYALDLPQDQVSKYFYYNLSLPSEDDLFSNDTDKPIEVETAGFFDTT